MAGGIGKILGGLADLIERLEEVRDTVETGEFEGKQVKGVYGVSVKMGLGGDDDEVSFEPFGHTARPEAPSEREVPVQGVREPLVDLIEEEDGVSIVGELPGVAADQVTVTVEGDVLTLSAEARGQRFHKELLLPFTPENPPEWTVNNGIVEIRVHR